MMFLNYYVKPILTKCLFPRNFHTNMPQPQLQLQPQSNYNSLLGIYNDLVTYYQVPPIMKLPPYLINRYNSESDYNNEICKISKINGKMQQKHRLICLDGQIVNGVEIADLYDINNKYLYHIKRDTKNIRVLSSQLANSALLLNYYANMLTASQPHHHNNKSDKLYDDLDKYVKSNKIDVLNTTYVFGIIIPKNYKLQNISINSRLSIGITCRILSSLNLKYYIDFIPQV